YTHQDIPFERLVEALNPQRSLARHPLFQIMLTLQNTPQPDLNLPGITPTAIDVTGNQAKFDLLLDLRETFDTHGQPTGITGDIEYALDLYDAGTVATLGARLTRVLELLAVDPDRRLGDLQILRPEEREQLLHHWGQGTPAQPPTTLTQAFTHQATQTPDAIAITAGDRNITYTELDTLSNQWAHHLHHHGVTHGTPVALLLDRTPELITAQLAITKAGGFYIPLHDAHPTERLTWIINNIQAPLLITDRTNPPTTPHTHTLPLNQLTHHTHHHPTTPPHTTHTTHPHQPAYAIYTSGTTGHPKGVIATHANITHLTNDPHLTTPAHHTILMHSSHAFDATTYETWTPLLNGGRIVIAPGNHLEPDTLRTAITQHHITAAFLTTALFNTIALETPETFHGLQHILFGGDKANPDAVHHTLKHSPHTHITHVYGPTETTTFTTAHPIPPTTTPTTPPTTPPIGTPMSGTHAYILDNHLQPTPPGVPGELYIAGTGLTHGYAHRPDLTAERFTANPHGTPGTRMYRTGDLARWTPHGTIDYLTRTDNQIKIRGYRIEPAEIETTLTTHPHITQAAVTIHEDPPGN
ncbi:amino acid adenylation domain-containing protein, partial [Streptomyces sp. NPDC092296]|uniref:non-ribosomal peptide synthetase n=1 Tax=Streptomyces sp. NPDC092296 TaxID=3366012 RepID=UPI0037F24CC3